MHIYYPKVHNVDVQTELYSLLGKLFLCSCIGGHVMNYRIKLKKKKISNYKLSLHCLRLVCARREQLLTGRPM